MDHLRQGTLETAGLRAFVLDEADEMLRMGFIDDVQWILEQLPEQRQVVLFSATMPPEIRRIAQRHLREPAEVIIRTQRNDAARIRQHHIITPPAQKLAALQRVLEAHGRGGVIIFARTKAVTVTVAEALEASGTACAVLNGDIPQNLRERTIERLKDGRVDVLVATDVAARGLDVDRIGLVVNYDVPFDSEAYVHRIGRTGRAGREGEAILFLTPRERRLLHGLERAVGQAIEPMDVPGDAAINQRRLDRLQERLVEQLEQPPAPGRQEEVALMEEIILRLSREREVAPERLALAALRLAQGDQPLLVAPTSFHVPERAPRGEGPGPGRGEGRSDAPVPLPAGMVRYRVEIGWRHRVKPGQLVGAIAGDSGIEGRRIGRITILADHSTVDLPDGLSERQLDGLQRCRVMQRELRPRRIEVG